MEQAELNRIARLDGVQKIRAQFPMLKKRIKSKPSIYFDNAASGHKPQAVLDSLQEFYSSEYAKPQEEHILSREATERIQGVRKKIAAFIGAASDKNIVFTRGCTEGINIVAVVSQKEYLKRGTRCSLRHWSTMPTSFPG